MRGKILLTELGPGTRGLVILVFLGFFLLLSSSSQGFTPLELATAPELVEAVEANRVLKFLSEEEAGERIKDFLYNYDEFKEVDPDQFQRPERRLPSQVGKEEALEDVDFLFQVLKYGYAGYELYGGDEVFEHSRKLIREEIGALKEMSHEQFSAIVFNNLSFINDGHFRFAGKNTFTSNRYNTNSDFDFFRDERGFFLVNGEETLYLDSINGKPPEDYLKLSLNEKGALVYRLGVLHPIEEMPYQVTLSFQAEDRDDKRVYLFPVESLPADGRVYEYYEKEGLPVIVNRIASARHEEKIRSFFAGAKDLQDTEIAILDIRGHTGGTGEIPREWVRRYTSSPGELQTPSLFVDLRTRTAQEIQVNWAKWNGRDGSFLQKRFSPIPGGWSEVQYSLPEFYKNDRYLIVLMDGNTVSAGEFFVKILKQVENVIMIGSNTRGAMAVGNLATFYLPHSSIPVQMGSSLFLEMDLSTREGIGYEPDIWVEPEEALELAIKFVDNYLR